MTSTLRLLVGITAFIAAFSVSQTTQAALVIQSLITNSVHDDLAGTSTFDVEIRAGVDSGNLEAYAFSLQLSASVSPTSVTEIANSNSSGWRDPDFEYNTSTGLGSPNVRVEANLNNFVAPPAKLIDFLVSAPNALIGTYQFVFSRQIGSGLPVSFDLTPIAFTGTGDVPSTQIGFIENDVFLGFQRIDSFPDDYSSAQGLIAGLTAVPEPGSLVLLAVGCVGLIRRRAR